MLKPRDSLGAIQLAEDPLITLGRWRERGDRCKAERVARPRRSPTSDKSAIADGHRSKP
jgi:hypothetical protein